jgi:hypothetical protein
MKKNFLNFSSSFIMMRERFGRFAFVVILCSNFAGDLLLTTVNITSKSNIPMLCNPCILPATLLVPRTQTTQIIQEHQVKKNFTPFWCQPAMLLHHLNRFATRIEESSFKYVFKRVSLFPLAIRVAEAYMT